MRGQFECDITLVLFLFGFRSFTCTVQLLFHSLLEKFGRGRCLKLDVPGQEGRKMLDVDGQRVGVLKIRQYSWTSYM